MAVAAAPFPALQAPLSSLQLLPLPSRSRRKPSPCPLIKIQCKDVDDRVWIIQRCPYSVEQLSSLLPGRQVISYAGLLSVAQAAHAHNGLGQHASDASGGISPSPSRLGFRSSLSSSSGRSKTGGLGGMHKRPSLSGSISSMSGLIGSGTGSTSGGSPLAAEILDTYTDKVDGLLRKIIRQRRDDDPAVRDWFDPGWGVPVESECTLDGCRLRHFQGLQRLPGPDTQRQISPPLSVQVHSPPLASSGLQAGGLISETGAVVDRNFSLDLGRFSPFDAGSQFHSPSSSLRSERFFESSQQQRRSQEALGVGAPPVARLGSFAEESVQPTAESTPRLPVSVESQVSTPRPEHDSPTETLYDSEGVVEAEVKWILENFPLPPPKAKALPTMAKRQMPVGHQRSRTPPQSPTSVEIRLRQASLTPSSTYSGMSALSRETDTTLATTVSTGWSSRSRGSTSTCASGRTDGSDGQVPSSRSSRDSGGPIALSNANVSGMRPSASSAGRTGDKTPRDGRTGRDLRPHSDESLVSPKTPSTSLPTVVDWRPKTPPPPPPTQLPSMQSRRPAAGPPAAPLPPPPTGPPPSKPPPPPPSASINDADLEERPFAALLKAESPLSLGDPIRLPTGPRQFSSVSVLPSSGSSPGLQAGRSPSPRKGSLLPTSSLEASPDGFRYHRPHQGMLNPYLRKSPSLSVSTLPSIHSAHSASSISPEASSMALPRSATTATLASPGGNVEGTKIFKVFIPSAERTISVSVGPNDSLLNLRDKIATKLRRTQLELPDKWSLATAQLSSTREKIVGDRELEALLAGRLRNGDPAQPCVLRVVEA